MEIAMQIANGDDVLRRRRLGRAERETGEQERRRPDNAMDQPQPPSG
jgi:hypothetical protein